MVYLYPCVTPGKPCHTGLPRTCRHIMTGSSGRGAKSNMDRDVKKLLSPIKTWAKAKWNICHISEYVENHQHIILLVLWGTESSSQGRKFYRKHSVCQFTVVLPIHSFITQQFLLIFSSWFCTCQSNLKRSSKYILTPLKLPGRENKTAKLLDQNYPML